MTELCEIGYKYGTDKTPKIKHYYTEVYYDLFKDRRDSVKKVLEIGIGFPDCMSKFFKDYITGASLYMWRELFPNAQIYGADIEPSSLISDDRIATFLCDERKEEDIKKLIETVGSDVDLFVDNGTHYVHEQIFLCKTAMPLLKDDVIYVIEDVLNSRILMKALSEYDCVVPHAHTGKYRDCMVIVRKK